VRTGANLILVASNAEHLAHAATNLQNDHVTLTTVPFDLRNYRRSRTGFCRGQPDILVNAAGITRTGEATELTLADWNETLSINTTAVFELESLHSPGN
jgi:short-subunit dehydrogenase